ncbi:acyltransferase family protein [Silvibacterium dinghuense]|uniref:Acyltransferase n=1 Tax=Silvibacterium dinghuense TaxID=1560006 RepID=A0A4Q1SBG9_9BACT|nr:acyltransferase [Silvibacterium dinghuense]RXS94466.1 acyltransferase [Silvibacterium dinghuense]GGH15919.1 hypothetical protein GCM10011586_37370 [Silvibacterium dinghuense]
MERNEVPVDEVQAQKRRIPSHRIPSLDGMRAVAILMVIALHLTQRYRVVNTHTAKGLVLYFLFGLGGDGVGIFFVLSGFLITTLLLREQEKTGRVSLADFYLRRTFRILPPLYAYLLFVIAFCVAIHTPLHLATILGSALFYRNYVPGDAQWFTEHTWSLCVEEQFYLLWPLLFLLAWRRGGRRAAGWCAAVLIVATPVLRVATKLAFPHVHHLDEMLHGRMDALMAGCLAAILIGTRPFESFYTRVVARIWWLLPLEFLVFSGAATLAAGVNYHNSIGFTIDSLCIALFLVWVSRNAEHWVGRILNWQPVVWIGVLSYSAYLWQTFFIHTDNPTRAKAMPWGFFLIWIAAALSYFVVEQPSLRMRKRIEARRTGHPGLSPLAPAPSGRE